MGGTPRYGELTSMSLAHLSVFHLALLATPLRLSDDLVRLALDYAKDPKQSDADRLDGGASRQRLE